MNQESKLRKSIRRWIVIFVVLLILSGLTAFPVETELRWLLDHVTFLPDFMNDWLVHIYEAVSETNEKYPQLAYGTDWLAFSHLVIAVAFIGPWIDPVKNVWIFVFGMIACAMVIPLAFICGPIREIPLYWTLIDCSFGVFGSVPLWICFQKVKKIESLSNINEMKNRMKIIR